MRLRHGRQIVRDLLNASERDADQTNKILERIADCELDSFWFAVEHARYCYEAEQPITFDVTDWQIILRWHAWEQRARAYAQKIVHEVEAV